ncbi:MAG: bifunctional NADP-dependent methylenetetrahydromethanopterin dehydrogenase/methylenetetrahydrofolate dehydrogenase [Planctomycetota bacterium]|nr:MAG: bifunctional NADP-dependent methylenetetrahydromethanopterin dehydrogenase/methylenetetrahydrofolate dehydrogenase [Planctomycetota bacterium]
MKTILIQLDTDAQPSTFDRVVAVDAGTDHLFSYGGVTPDNLTPLVHGAIFTRGPQDLSQTAIFIGGSDVAAGEKLLETVQSTFFGPMRVSVMMDSNGCNTTAAAAVLAAARHVSLSGARALVLGGTGPVGQRAGLLLARQGACVSIASRSADRAEAVCERLREQCAGAEITACESAGDSLASELSQADILISAGAAGVQFLSTDQWQSAGSLKVAVDLNAVPPVGLEGIEVTEKAKQHGDVVCYGAVGVGGTKMKVHKAAVQRLFEANDRVLNTAEIYSLAEEIG